MQKIVPFLWFKDNAEEAVKFYLSVFPDSKILGSARYGETGPGPKGAIMTVDFQLAGQAFMALNGGPVFQFTPAVSFFVRCATPKEVEALWAKLSPGGSVLMPLAKYPFSEKYGWLNDRFGISWQLLHSAEPVAQKIAPCVMFIGKQQGKAEAAIRDYVSLFHDSKVNLIARYEAGEGDVAGNIKHASFSLHGQDFTAMDSSKEFPFSITPAISFMVNCQTQDEVDLLWEKLSAGGRPDQCGWLHDKYDVSWQIVPTVLAEMMQDPDPVKSGRVMKAMLQMTKMDIAKLKKAYAG